MQDQFVCGLEHFVPILFGFASYALSKQMSKWTTKPLAGTNAGFSRNETGFESMASYTLESNLSRSSMHKHDWTVPAPWAVDGLAMANANVPPYLRDSPAMLPNRSISMIGASTNEQKNDSQTSNKGGTKAKLKRSPLQSIENCIEKNTHSIALGRKHIVNTTLTNYAADSDENIVKQLHDALEKDKDKHNLSEICNPQQVSSFLCSLFYCVQYLEIYIYVRKLPNLKDSSMDNLLDTVEVVISDAC